jgi:(S)-mandelate dehydrogenase
LKEGYNLASVPMTDVAHLKNLSVQEIRELARRQLPRGLFEFIDRGTEDEWALRNNRKAFERIKLRPRVLVDVSSRSMIATLFGRELSMPLAIAPTGAAGLVCFEGEIALARAAAAMGVPFTLATRSMSSIETIADKTGGNLWFQLYPSSPDTENLMRRAWAAGYNTLVVTVDTPTAPLRRYNAKNGFSLPYRPGFRSMLDMIAHPAWFASVLGRYILNGGLPRFENLEGCPKITQGAPASAMLSGKLDWDRIKQLRDNWQGTFLIKGILDPLDAMTAITLGANGIIVSNHGGRNLDSSLAPLDILSEVVAEIEGQVPVIVDGAILRGSDIAKAVALGASAVLVGRATLYGASVGGEQGALQVLKTLQTELDYTMTMTGCTTLADLSNRLHYR